MITPASARSCGYLDASASLGAMLAERDLQPTLADRELLAHWLTQTAVA
ncbi:hypothetical protein OG883_16095 [Streptomyces sp. NBC_01142]|nr:hypothetical protein [Streptomyces sp. NBC_01142]MCX4821398.1 hypothetical protein [Streptomyces sp. NBC_01142]